MTRREKTARRLGRLEPLEGRIALSTMTPVATPLVAADVATTSQRSTTPLRGSFRGSVAIEGPDLVPADGPTNYRFRGTGAVNGRSGFQLDGLIQMRGFMLPTNPMIVGRVTLRDARGSVTLDVSGNNLFGDDVNRLNYRIVSGTGSYRRASDRGVMEVVSTLGGDGQGYDSFQITLRSRSLAPPKRESIQLRGDVAGTIRDYGGPVIADGTRVVSFAGEGSVLGVAGARVRGDLYFNTIMPRPGQPFSTGNVTVYLPDGALQLRLTSVATGETVDQAIPTQYRAEFVAGSGRYAQASAAGVSNALFTFTPVLQSQQSVPSGATFRMQLGTALPA